MRSSSARPRSRSLATGSALTLGSQIFVAAVQIGYAAFASRLVAPDDFGTYAVALLGAALLSQLFSSGTQNSVARSTDLSSEQVRSIASSALVLGVAGAAFCILMAGPWASLWGQPGAAVLLVQYSLALLISPYAGMIQGMARRDGKFARLALANTVSGVLVLILGTAAVVVSQTASALMVTLTLTPWTLLLACSVSCRTLPRPGRIRRSARSHSVFSRKVRVAYGLMFISMAGMPLAISRWLGAATLGQFNRAFTLTVVPLDLFRVSITTTIYPALAKDADDNSRTRLRWPDLLGLVGWITVVPSLALCLLMPQMMALLLGPQWSVAGLLAVPLLVVGGLSASTMTLYLALEAANQFKIVFSSLAANLVVTCAGMAMIWLTQQLYWVPITMLSAVVAMHIGLAGLAVRSGMLDGRHLCVRYAQVLGAGLLGAIVCAGCLLVAQLEAPLLLRTFAVVLGVVATTGVVVWFRDKLPPVLIAREYGLIGPTKEHRFFPASR